VYRAPANLFVARFIGSPPMNTVTGAVVSSDTGGDDLALELPGSRIPLPAPLVAVVREADVTDVVVGARPEDLRFGGPGQGLPATVAAVESLGHERHVVCRLTDGQLVIVRQAVDDPAPAPDEQVHVLAHVDRLHLFDPAGPRIG
jgi:ABC-type sugar transport system ATPase subunit